MKLINAINGQCTLVFLDIRSKTRGEENYLKIKNLKIFYQKNSNR